MNTTTEPPVLRRTRALAELYLRLGVSASHDKPVSLARIRDIHHDTLGPTRRKRTGHFELRDERTLIERLHVRGLTLFLPSAHAALQSVREQHLLREPPLGKRYSVYAMLTGDQAVALARHDTALGSRLLDGQATELVYDEEALAYTSGIRDPETRVRTAAILDLAAVYEMIGKADR